MKKCLVFCLMLVAFFSCSSFAIASQESIEIMLDNKAIISDVPPQIINGRTLVPIRFVATALDADVIWDGINRVAFVKKAGLEIKMTIDGEVRKNGNIVTIDVPPTIIDDRTMVPLRFISEAFGCKVDWNQENRIVVITTKQPIDENKENTSFSSNTTPSVSIPSVTTQVLPSVKTFTTFSSLEIGKKLLVVELDTTAPENFDVSCAGVALKFNVSAQKFTGNVAEADAIQAKVVVTAKHST